jgi:alkylhydroperoxidase/carboxymuconolactone decarboxylase family protein YurZ
LYPHISSYDGILDKLESSQAIISSLIAIDCTGQARNHMKGMLWNGASREEVTMARDIVAMIAERLGVRFKGGKVVDVPELPDL